MCLQNPECKKKIEDFHSILELCVAVLLLFWVLFFAVRWGLPCTGWQVQSRFLPPLLILPPPTPLQRLSLRAAASHRQTAFPSLRPSRIPAFLPRGASFPLGCQKNYTKIKFNGNLSNQIIESKLKWKDTTD